MDMLLHHLITKNKHMVAQADRVYMHWCHVPHGWQAWPPDR
jgi:hypothetical protein